MGGSGFDERVEFSGQPHQPSRGRRGGRHACWPRPDETSLGLGRLYLLITLVMLLVTFLIEGRPVAPSEACRGGSASVPGHAPLRWVIPPVVYAIAVPLLWLIGLPRLLGVPLSELVLQMPGAGYWTI